MYDASTVLKEGSNGWKSDKDFAGKEIGARFKEGLLLKARLKDPVPANINCGVVKSPSQLLSDWRHLILLGTLKFPRWPLDLRLQVSWCLEICFCFLVPVFLLPKLIQGSGPVTNIFEELEYRKDFQTVGL